MKYSKGTCIDVGTEHCPCALALTGDCLVCSRLQGKDCCDCKWSGVCVYEELVQNGGKVRGTRRDFAADVLKKEEFGEGETALTVLTLGGPRGFALRAALPGSFVFLRRKETDLWCNVPLSVLQADPQEGTLSVAVKVISAKTKALLEEEGALLVRGVYRSGIQGSEALLNLGRGARVLLVTRGVGIAPGILIARYLAGRADCDFLVDDETISSRFLLRYLEGCGSVRCLRFGTEDPAGVLAGALAGAAGLSASSSDGAAGQTAANATASSIYDAVVLLVSDYYQDLLAPVARQKFPGAALCLANNFRMCCGEGLCGACTYRTEEGEILKMCKCTTIF